jgi:hypothetical protein
MVVLPVRNQEDLLMDYVRRLAERPAGRAPALIAASSLQPARPPSSPGGLRSMAEAAEGQLFVLKSADTLFVYKADVHQRVEQEIQKIRFLFSDDPALMDARSAADFVCRFDVQAEYERFQSLVRDLVNRNAAPASYATCRLTAKERLKRRQTVGQPLTPDLLAKLEAALSRADLSILVRRRKRSTAGCCSC